MVFGALEVMRGLKKTIPVSLHPRTPHPKGHISSIKETIVSNKDSYIRSPCISLRSGPLKLLSTNTQIPGRFCLSMDVWGWGSTQPSGVPGLTAQDRTSRNPDGFLRFRRASQSPLGMHIKFGGGNINTWGFMIIMQLTQAAYRTSSRSKRA